MLKLITYPAAFGAPSASPFGVKAMCFLKMAGADWEMGSSADPRKAPKGKLPMLIDGETRIPDSEDIRAYLEQKFNVDFDEGLSAEQRAVARAIIRMCDEHLYFALVCDRWLDDANWEIVREEFFGMIPKLVRGFVTKKIRQQVHNSMQAQGMGRHTVEERLTRADIDIRAVMALLGDKPFLFGETPTAADASAAPVLAAMAGSPTKTLLSKRVKNDAPLTAYLERVQSALYP
ncbi:MAG TPA: glutathione S-transferase family protein [Rhodobacteraceae bacterium]|nr:glutathione S-transferase family protein [Paracoccaceae bacterium]